MKTPDLTYMSRGMFTTFMPNTLEGVTAWQELAKQTDGTSKVPSAHAAATARQLRAAGYTVRKLR